MNNTTTTQRLVHAYGRVEAMALGELADRKVHPGAVATRAVKASTTKAQRAMIARHPERQPWLVEIAYDLVAAAAALQAELDSRT